MYLFQNLNINFLKWRVPVVIASLIFIATGMGLILTRGLNVGIDFAGGANVVVRFQESPSPETLRAIVPDAVIQQYGPVEDHSTLFRLPQQDIEGDYAGELVEALHTRLNPDQGDKLDLNYQGSDAIAELISARNGLDELSAEALADRIIERRSELELFSDLSQVEAVEGVTPAIASTLKNETFTGAFTILSQETVGPQIGSELQQKAIWAIVLSILAMGAYIALRFSDWKFGIGAIVCLFHDISFALAFLAMMGGEFEIITVSALLMIIGYSINDTVVVYDRVRENIRKKRGKVDFPTVINTSINQTLSRTILTTGTTAFAIICLIAFGGEVIREFSWVLLVGAIAGTASSIFIIPTVVLALRKWFDKDSVVRDRSRAATPVARNQKSEVRS